MFEEITVHTSWRKNTTKTSYNRRVITAISIALMVLLPLPTVRPVDTALPQISNVEVDPSVIRQADMIDNIGIQCYVHFYYSSAQTVSLNISGPRGPLNISQWTIISSNGIEYTYIFNTTIDPGTYYFYIWARDSLGNTNSSASQYFIILDEYKQYVYVDVNSTGPSFDGTAARPFPSIGQGLSAVNPGGTINIHHGTYHEQIGIYGKPVALKGEQKENTIIEGGIELRTVNASHSKISNVTIRNPTYWGYGIWIDGPNNNTITNCIITNNQGGGIGLGSNSNTITHCDIQNNGIGIDFFNIGNHNIIYHNNFLNNTEQIAHVNPGSTVWDDGSTGNYWDNYRTVYPNAHILLATGTWDTPYVITTNNIDHHPWVNPNGLLNSPPSTPNAPSGPITGYTNTTNTYSTNTVTDPDGDPVFYQFSWGDNTTASWTITPTATHQWMHPGNYIVKVKARDSNNLESSWSDPLHVIITSQQTPENQIEITTPPSITEGTTFSVTITVNEAILPNAMVTFAGTTKYTDADGQVTFTAPEVQRNTPYTLTAQHSGYISSTTTVVVLNQEQPLGYIYGIARDSSTNAPLQTVTITVYLSTQENKITFTDADGRYNILVPVGTYTVEASNPGYRTQTKQNIPVLVNSAIEQNFLLEKTQTTTPEGTDHQSSVIEYTIQEKASQGTIGARINLQQTEKTVSYYSPQYTINLQPTNDTNISFTISADDNVTATIIVVRIGPGVLSDLDNISLTYDGILLNETAELETFFAVQDNVTPSWFGVLTRTGLYAFIRVPHFSTHAITISSLAHIVEAIGGIMVLIFYLTIAVVVALVIVAPIIIIERKRK